MRRTYRVAARVLAVCCVTGVMVASARQAPPPRFLRQVSWAGRGVWLRADTHVHTRFSDGDQTIEQLVARAAQNGCDVIAITDHTDRDLTAATPEYFAAIDAARAAHPTQVIIAGVEWNIPPYDGREHATVLAPPDVERRLSEFKDRFDDLGRTPHDAALAIRGLRWLATEMKSGTLLPVVTYEHPSRKDESSLENAADVRAWRAAGDLVIGFSGAPGHQGKAPFGAYETKAVTIDRWDPVAARLGDAWDTLLGEGLDVWGAIAPSDFHNNSPAALGDYWPCQFSETWVYAPDRTVAGVLRALRAGSFFGDHGRIVKEAELRVSTAGLPRAAVAGESIAVAPGARATAEIRVVVSERLWDGSPGSIDRLELIGVTPSGATSLASAGPEMKTPVLTHTLVVPASGLVIRARGRHSSADGTHTWFYSNPVRLVVSR